jgi:hypothetical protein
MSTLIDYYYNNIDFKVNNLYIRCFILFIVYKLWFLSQNFINYTNNSNKFEDRTHILTSNIHKILKNNIKLTKYLFILTSLIIDILMSLIIIDYIFNNNSIEVKILIYTIIMRQINQYLVSFPSPNEILWTNPGFPSIFVTYEVTNDYYFSGHTSFAVICGMFLERYKYVLLGRLNIILQICILIFTRSHYFPDIITGFIMPYFIKYMLEL